MRVKTLYALRDKRAATIVGPISHDYSPVPIIRELTGHANNKEHFVGQAPADYDLISVGQIDEETGLVEADGPHVIINCNNLINAPK
jgi:hypothetical protein